MGDREMGGDRYTVRPYVDLIDQFLSRRRRAAEKVFRVLDRLFAEFDAFVPDPELRDEGDLDEEGCGRPCRMRRLDWRRTWLNPGSAKTDPATPRAEVRA